MYKLKLDADKSLDQLRVEHWNRVEALLEDIANSQRKLSNRTKDGKNGEGKFEYERG